MIFESLALIVISKAHLDQDHKKAPPRLKKCTATLKISRKSQKPHIPPIFQHKPPILLIAPLKIPSRSRFTFTLNLLKITSNAHFLLDTISIGNQDQRFSTSPHQNPYTPTTQSPANPDNPVIEVTHP